MSRLCSLKLSTQSLPFSALIKNKAHFGEKFACNFPIQLVVLGHQQPFAAEIHLSKPGGVRFPHISRSAKGT